MFVAKDCNAQFSQIFQENVFQFVNDIEKAIFLSSYQYNELCESCQCHCRGTVSVFVQYLSSISFDESDRRDLSNIYWPQILLSQNLFIQNINCSSCDRRMNVNNLYATPSFIMFIEFSPEIMNKIRYFDEIDIQNVTYCLSAFVRNPGGHFSVAVKKNSTWLYIDDLKRKIEVFQSLRDLRSEYQNGWFFCCYIQKTINDKDCNANLSDYLSDHCNFQQSSQKTNSYFQQSFLGSPDSSSSYISCCQKQSNEIHIHFEINCNIPEVNNSKKVNDVYNETKNFKIDKKNNSKKGKHPLNSLHSNKPVKKAKHIVTRSSGATNCFDNALTETKNIQNNKRPCFHNSSIQSGLVLYP